MAGFQQLRVTREVDFTGATILGAGGVPGALASGKTFYVDATSGADGYGTLSQNFNYPLETITAAMDLCTANKGDTIVVLANSPSSPAANETFPIAMDVGGVLLTGMYSRGLLSDSGFGTDVLNGNTITVSANYATIENLYLGVKTGGSTGNVIEGGASAFSFTLRNCYIEAQYTALYGFYTGGSYDFPYLLLEDNVWGDNNSSKFTNAIRLFNATRGMVRRNVFGGCSSYTIDLLASCGTANILDNRFHLSADTDGFAVYATSGSTGNYIDGNHAAYGLSTMTNDPFWEGGSDGDNNWGINYKNATAISAART